MKNRLFLVLGIVFVFIIALLVAFSSQPDQKPSPSSSTDQTSSSLEPTAVPEPLDNLASLAMFPDLAFETSMDFTPNGDPRYPLTEGEVFHDDQGNAISPYWAAPVPATYDIYWPDDVPVELARVELQDIGGDFSFDNAEILLKPTPDSDWLPVSRLAITRQSAGESAHGAVYRHVYSFTPQTAVAVRVLFAKGCPKFPGRVYVADLDVFGSLLEP